jgi:hypothetical protein
VPGKVLIPSTRKSLSHPYLGGGEGRVWPFQITCVAGRMRPEVLVHN